VVAREAVQARILRAVAAPGQLRELLVDFWFNHFNVDAGHGLARIWAGAFEREAIRPHAMGRFLDLLAATAMHPAMLIYRENWRTGAPRGTGEPGADDPASGREEAAGGESPDQEDVPERAGGLDETYAGTLLAVHTLGDETAYTAEDRTALARVFTGLRLGAPRSETDKERVFLRSGGPRPHGQGLPGPDHPRRGHRRGRGGPAHPGRASGHGRTRVPQAGGFFLAGSLRRSSWNA
jgi:uncharacterized protein (DUF1800 family)